MLDSTRQWICLTWHLFVQPLVFILFLFKCNYMQSVSNWAQCSFFPHFPSLDLLQTSWLKFIFSFVTLKHSQSTAFLQRVTQFFIIFSSYFLYPPPNPIPEESCLNFKHVSSNFVKLLRYAVNSAGIRLQSRILCQMWRVRDGKHVFPQSCLPV